ncbi:pilus assembly protein [Pseudomonas carnis]|uniref:TrbC family F-type conjugative pilus assembly protein n=1 Tax=Pseudomonas carnis TaxID=2487355 RepID=UPI001C6F7E2E|nr:TrbC family F-type conjugative pilus assembly protein [Pseudomonas carnis]MBW9241021.1 pilus assembly protein [Pseudomonas carnis]
MVSLRSALLCLVVIGSVAPAYGSTDFAAQESAAIESFKEVLDGIKTNTDKQVDFVLKTEDLSFAQTPLMPDSNSAIPAPVEQARAYQIFVSWSLGESEIKNLLKEYHGNREVELVFRGIPDGVSLQDALAKVQRLSLETKSNTPVLINPVLFGESGIETVPQIRKVSGRQTVYVVSGTTSVQAAEEQYKKFKTPKPNAIGPGLRIAERDLIEVMKERLAKVNFAELKDKALRRFWSNQVFAELVPAPTSRVRKLDPSVVVPQDITGADGTLIHKAGDHINPLDIRPFTQRLVIIDPTYERQINFAKAQIEKYSDKQNVVIILSEVDREKGWDGFTEVQNKIGRAAYILKDDVRTRFSIDFTPSVVTAADKYFYIEEVAGESLP